MTVPLIGDQAVAITDWFEQLQAQGLSFNLEAQSAKFREEAGEFADEPTDMAEAADVFVSLIGALWVQGKDLQDLAYAVEAKMKVLRKRTWKLQADGTYHHVKGCENCGNDDGTHKLHLCSDCSAKLDSSEEQLVG